MSRVKTQKVLVKWIAFDFNYLWFRGPQLQTEEAFTSHLPLQSWRWRSPLEFSSSIQNKSLIMVHSNIPSCTFVSVIVQEVTWWRLMEIKGERKFSQCQPVRAWHTINTNLKRAQGFMAETHLSQHILVKSNGRQHYQQFNGTAGWKRLPNSMCTWTACFIQANPIWP